MIEEHICAYCGEKATYQLKNGKWCCHSSPNSCPSLRARNSNGLKKSYACGRINGAEKYKNSSQNSKDRQAWSRGKTLFSFDDVFCANSRFSTGTLKKYLLHYGIKEDKCDICGINKWQEKPITLQVHHIDGNPRNNVVDNLQLLCPNCHSQTDTFSGRNKSKFDWDRISIQQLESFASECTNYHQLLMKLNCASISSVSYGKIIKLCQDNNIELCKKKLNKLESNSKIKKEKSVNVCVDCGKKISNNAVRCKKCAAIKCQFSNRRVERPTKQVLQDEIKTNSFCALGRKYGVSDAAIKKWCYNYGIEFPKRKHIKVS